MKTVDDHAEEEESVFFEGVADFKDRSNASKQYSYDANGNMTKDLNKGIDTIRYNLLNLPQEIVFANGDRSLYKYNAAGIKYQVTHYTYLDTELNPIQGNGVAMYDTLTYDYDGSYVYRDHYFNMLMTPDGYMHISDITPENCFYAKDHLGNNRATYYITPMSELGVLVKDINNYYPFGMEFNEKPVVFNVGFNPELDFTYNGKESQTMHGLNMMDYGARFIDMANPVWPGPDPLMEKFYSISPYAYCAGNPMKFVDKEGRYIDIWYPGEKGNPINFRFDGTNGNKAPNNEFVQNVIKAYNYDVGNGGGDNFKEAATNNNLVINVAPNWVGTDKTDYFHIKENIIHWNPNKALRFADDKLSISPATILEHEMAHAVAANKDLLALYKRLGIWVDFYGNAEERRVMQGAERKTAIKNGEIKNSQQRINHSAGYLYPVADPTSTISNYVVNTSSRIIYFWLTQNPNIIVTYK